MVLEKIFWKKNFKFLIDKIITPSVDIIIPLIPIKFNFSLSNKYSNIATWTTSVLLSEVPTTKFENLNKYNNTKVNITWKIDARVTFIFETLQQIRKELQDKHKSSIGIYFGTPLKIYKQLTKEFEINSVYTNHDYEPYAKERDEDIKQFLDKNDIY